MEKFIKVNIDSAGRKLKEIETSIQNIDTTKSRVERACEQGIFNRDEVITEVTTEQVLLDLEINNKKGGE